MPKDEVSYEVLNVPLLGRNLAASRSPRLQPTVPEEYGDMLSNEVERGMWTTDPTNGEPLSAKGQTLQQHLEFTLSTRPHWLLPQILEDEAEKVWLSGNLTEQGRRFEQIKKFANGSHAAALVLFEEEAERFGTKPGSTKPGVKPGDVGDGATEKKAPANLSTNPWSREFRGDAAAREKQIASIIKTGTRFANALAKAAGTTIGRPLTK
jgi:hypothetical protein